MVSLTDLVDPRLVYKGLGLKARIYLIKEKYWRLVLCRTCRDAHSMPIARITKAYGRSSNLTRHVKFLFIIAFRNKDRTLRPNQRRVTLRIAEPCHIHRLRKCRRRTLAMRAPWARGSSVHERYDAVSNAVERSSRLP